MKVFVELQLKAWRQTDESISSLEEKIAALEKEIAAAASEYSKLTTLMAEKEQTEALLDEKMERWVYLNDLAEQIEASRKQRIIPALHGLPCTSCELKPAQTGQETAPEFQTAHSQWKWPSGCRPEIFPFCPPEVSAPGIL